MKVESTISIVLLVIIVTLTFFVAKKVSYDNKYLVEPSLGTKEVLHFQSRKLMGKGCSDPLWRDLDCWKDVALEDIPSLITLSNQCKHEEAVQEGGHSPRTLYTMFTLNGWAKTHTHIASLSRVNETIELLVLDDGSEDETLEELEKLGIKVAHATMPPQGVTYGWNLAYAYFWAHCYDYLFITNNDLVVPSGAYGKVLSALIDTNCSMAGPTTTFKGAGRNGRTQTVQKTNGGLQFPELNYLERTARSGHRSEQNKDVERLWEATNHVQKMIETKWNSPNAQVKTVAADHPLTSINGFFFALRRDSLHVRFNNYHLLDPKNRNIRNEYDLQRRIVKELNDARICIVRNAFVYHFKGATIPMDVNRENWGKHTQRIRARAAIQEANQTNHDNQ